MGNNPLSATTAIVKEGKKNSLAPLTDILKMRMDGLKLREIAEKYGVTQQAISRRITGAFKVLDGEKLKSVLHHPTCCAQTLGCPQGQLCRAQ